MASGSELMTERGWLEMPTGNEPVSVNNLKALMGGGFLGGTLLFDNPSGAQSGTLSQSANNFSHLLVTASAYVDRYLRVSSVIAPGGTMDLGNTSNFGNCKLTVSGTSFTMTDAYCDQECYSIIGFNFS